MLNGLRGLVSWLDALLSIETTRDLAEEAYDHTVHEIARRSKRVRVREENSKRNSALFQNLLLTTLPEVIKAISQRSSPAPKPTLFPTGGIDNDRPVTVHRRKPSMEEAPRVDVRKDLEVKGDDYLMNLDERLTFVEKVLSDRQCLTIADTDSILRRNRAPGAVRVKVLRADQLADWAKDFFGTTEAQRASAPAEECTPVDTSSSCEDKLD